MTVTESDLRTMLRYADMTVDGMFVSQNACPECLKPFAPYGVAVNDSDGHRFCWRTHEQDALMCELEDLRAQRDAVLALHAPCRERDGQEIPAFCVQCSDWDSMELRFADPWPCPTVRALGIIE